MPEVKKVKKPKTSIVKRRPASSKIDGATPATVLKIQEAAKMLAKGKSRATIIEHLMTTYGMAAKTASDYYDSATRFLLPDDESKFKESLIKANATRLETIYERAMENNDFKNAREAVAELNKMLGVGKEGITVGINTDKEADTQQVVIRFDK